MAASLSPWWELHVNVPTELADDIAATLIDYGALGAYIDEPLAAEPLQSAISHLVVSFSGESASDAILQHAQEAFSELNIPFEPQSAGLQKREDTDWAERWKEHYAPIQIGQRLWIVPAWQTDFQPPQTRSAPSEPPGPASPVLVHIDPGMAFGTGQHATTALCLEIMLSHIQNASNLLDVGCGSGILGIAGALLGCKSVIAIDNDPDAVNATIENARLNDVEHLLQASEQPVESFTQPFDWTVANIIAPVLEEMSLDLVRLTKPGGQLLLSGILSDQAEDIEQAIAKAANILGREVALAQTLSEGEWVAMRFTCR